jgi:glycine cleavage system aminomethyltransferase T
MLCTLTIDDHTAGNGMKRYPLGREPVTLRDGAPLTDAHGRRSYVTSAGAGPSIGKHVLMAYLPPEHANEGEELAVEYMTELLPATVQIVGSTPPFDPENERIRG